MKITTHKAKEAHPTHCSVTYYDILKFLSQCTGLHWNGHYCIVVTIVQTFYVSLTCSVQAMTCSVWLLGHVTSLPSPVSRRIEKGYFPRLWSVLLVLFSDLTLLAGWDEGHVKPAPLIPKGALLHSHRRRQPSDQLDDRLTDTSLTASFRGQPG